MGDVLREALEPNGLLIVDLVPELKHVLANSTGARAAPQEAQRRFQLVFGGSSVCSRAPSIRLRSSSTTAMARCGNTRPARRLLTSNELQHLLLIARIGTTRSMPPTRDTQARRDRQTGAAVQDIVLTPLGRDDLGQLLADTLHCPPKRATPLAELIHEKTTGNRFLRFNSFLRWPTRACFHSITARGVGSGTCSAFTPRLYGNVVELMSGS